MVTAECGGVHLLDGAGMSSKRIRCGIITRPSPEHNMLWLSSYHTRSGRFAYGRALCTGGRLGPCADPARHGSGRGPRPERLPRAMADLGPGIKRRRLRRARGPGPSGVI